MAETVETLNQIKRNEILMKAIVGDMEAIKASQAEIRANDLVFYTWATEWLNDMGMLEELLRQREHGVMTDQQRQQLEGLLVKLEEVKPIAERLNLAWYRNPPPERKPVVK